MNKTVGSALPTRREAAAWLELDAIAAVSVTSEDGAFEIENALRGTGAGWRASMPGVQHVVLEFPTPTAIRRIRVVCEERKRSRTQEFALEWRSADGAPPRQVVRQQFTFAPPGTTVETEDYRTDLANVVRLDLTIVPDIADPDAMASLKEFRIGG